MSVSDFVDDVVAYFAWLNGYRHSYVLNTTRIPTSKDLSLPRQRVLALPTQG